MLRPAAPVSLMARDADDLAALALADLARAVTVWAERLLAPFVLQCCDLRKRVSRSPMTSVVGSGANSIASASERAS